MYDHDALQTGRETRIPVDLSQPLELDVRTSHGNIAIRASDRPDVLVVTDGPAKFGAADDDETGVRIDVRGNRIEIRPDAGNEAGWPGFGGDFDLDNVVGQVAKAFRSGGPFLSGKPGQAWAGFGGDNWADIEIEIPPSMTARVVVHAASGDVRIEGVNGEIALQSMSGDQRVRSVRGTLTLKAASGDMIVEETRGRMTAHAASGDVRVTAAEIEAFQIQTASGDVSLDAVLAGDGPFSIKTASGDVRLALRKPAATGTEPGAALAFQTISGDARVSPPLHKSGRRRWQSGPADGRSQIDVTTVNGDLTASIAATAGASVPAPSPVAFPAVAPEPSPAADRLRADDGSAAAAMQPEAGQPAAPESTRRLAVLEAVERGELDIDEALRRLDAADGGANP